MTRALLVLLPALIVAAPRAHAHSGGVSYSSWRVEGRRVKVTVRLPLPVLAQSLVGCGLESGVFGASQLEQLRRTVAPYVGGRLRVSQGGAACSMPLAPALEQSPAEQLAVRVEYLCARSIEKAGLRLEVKLLFDERVGHVHLARIALPGLPESENAFTDYNPTWSWSPHATKSRFSALGQFLRLGVTHIFSGFDHLLFLLAMILLGGSLRSLLATITAFTLGHSLTLALAVLGWARPPEAVVEPLIALSIIALVAENLLATAATPGQRKASLAGLLSVLVVVVSLGVAGVTRFPLWASLGFGLFCFGYLALVWMRRGGAAQRACVTFLFGLIHGFGFARALIEMELPRRALAVSLLGFNLGVELGQAAVILLATVAARRLLLQRQAIPLVQIASMAIGCIAMLWLGQRLGV